MFSLHWPSMGVFVWCAWMFHSLHGIFCTYDPAELMEGYTVKDNENVTDSLLFYGLHSKSFSGHYDDDMLWITLKGILK